MHAIEGFHVIVQDKVGTAIILFSKFVLKICSLKGLATLRARALRATVFLGSLTRKKERCAPRPTLYNCHSAKLMIFRENP